ncbi:hypothetical protein GCM10011316_20810 [Roseibium aquae]|uniref:Glycosyltransferase 2-like domain-containing protein n=1 Tax=Roseibium aquae TaxID=1323746 RepID=A0A916TJL3_9HYPH|nr:glycosyltransferase family 2 protein [Roseibium aquae]GGB48514.1 hypothetical protein GCM10011316_20810 [Roseibium aquae]
MTAFHCAVVIPTKNALPGLRRVLSKVLAQKTPWPYEVIVIDSGSRDGTAEYLRKLDRVRLIEIPPDAFGHGKTRNLGVEMADAKFVAFLTHDAEPVEETWLARLVAAAEQDDQIAGVFGRHIAYATASPFTKDDLDRHFAGFLAHPLVVHRDLDPERYERDVGWRQFLHFYSDNNSLLRKTVWDQIPYPDVEFAEDQLWARTVIEAGYAKAYAPDAAVYHSHDFSPLEQLRRAFDESRNFKKYFGYDLSPGILQALASIVKQSSQALSQTPNPDRYGRTTLQTRSLRVAQGAALIFGHFLGTNHDKIPKNFSDKISLDRKLYKS